ncbi:hypothetical protein CWE07_06835 [Aliidiomarina maris]|uniref:Cryptochrome/DNA photolyase FAD-binding domain-containing protein n=1 Tax=Aliidiomarina maris TaxID=531312 RepID=A0ABY0BRP1_9GAMM|nr:hypothetical protein CWE07_06835 [Aliidiomarina maris]
MGSACASSEPRLACGRFIASIWRQPTRLACTQRFLSSPRLHWRCHFVQKFEANIRIEQHHFNPAYQAFEYRQDAQVERDLARWQTGQTGVPMVDACMRSLNRTGFLNFRMRAMLVSFLSHHLNIDWRLGAPHLGCSLTLKKPCTIFASARITPDLVLM